MPLLKFNVRWEDDMNVMRDIEILNVQTFKDFHEVIKKSFAFPPNMEAIFYVSNEFWRKEQGISSKVEKNVRGAEFLSMIRTPIGAFLKEQHQKFLYATDHQKGWELQIELISMREDPVEVSLYPICIREEGISPAQFSDKSVEKDAIVEIEEKYDLHASLDDMESEGEELASDDGDAGDADDFDLSDFDFGDE